MSRIPIILDLVASAPAFHDTAIGPGFVAAYASHGRAGAIEILTSMDRRADIPRGWDFPLRTSLRADNPERPPGVVIADPRKLSDWLWYRVRHPAPRHAMLPILGGGGFGAARDLARALIGGPYQSNDMIVAHSAPDAYAAARFCRGYAEARGHGEGKPALPLFGRLSPGFDVTACAPAGRLAGDDRPTPYGALSGPVLLSQARPLHHPIQRRRLLRALARLSSHHALAPVLAIAGTGASDLVGKASEELAGAGIRVVEAPPGDVGYRSADLLLVPPGTDIWFAVRALAHGLPAAGVAYGWSIDILRHEGLATLAPARAPDKRYPLGPAPDPRIIADGGDVDAEFLASVDFPVEDLAARIADVIGRPDRLVTMSDVARRYARARFAWPSVIKEFDTLLEGVKATVVEEKKTEPSAMAVSANLFLCADVYVGATFGQDDAFIGPGGESDRVIEALIERDRLEGAVDPQGRSLADALRVVANLFIAFDQWTTFEMIRVLRRIDGVALHWALNHLMAEGVLRPLPADSTPSQSAPCPPV